MQTIKEEWIKIYLLDNNSIVVFCTTKYYLSSCDNNEVFHIPASVKLFQFNPHLATIKVMPHSAHQNQAHHTLILAITSTCKWVWAISNKKNPSETTFHLIYGTLSMLGFDPTWWKWRDGSTLLHYTAKGLGHELVMNYSTKEPPLIELYRRSGLPSTHSI